MKRKRVSRRIISIILAVLMAVTGMVPAFSAFASDGVEGYYDIELFYKDTDTIVPTYIDDKAEDPKPYVEYMKEGETLNLTYKLIDTAMPDNGYIKWYSETPTLVDVSQEGVVKAFDSSKGAVIHCWIDNEVKTIPLVGSVIATVLEKALFNEYVDVDTMDTEAIIDIVEAAFGSDSLLDKWIESYKGELIDSLRYYLDNINSNIHVQLYSADGTLLDDDYIQICVVKNDEWYAAFLPNGTHITNKSQINTTVAVGSTVQLYAVTTPVRLKFGCVYSVKSTSVFNQGKVVATVNDSGLVTFKNKGTVTIMVSPDSEQVINAILALVNKIYQLDHTGTIDTDKVAGILIDYIGIDMNRNVLAALLDVCFAIKDIAGDAADPVQLTATAVKIIANLVLQFVYNDTITFNVVDAQPLTDFEIEGANTVKEGSQIKLEITNVQPEVGDTSDITWESSDPNIASVDPVTGVITGRDAGGSLGALSTQKCTIIATSAANNVSKSYEITVTGKTGKYLSDTDIIGETYLEMGDETDYTYTVYPTRVAESDNLYISWGIVTGEDEEGNTLYAWADDENPATDGRGQIDSKGHYKVISGGESNIVLKAQTGYYLSNGNFYEISSFIKVLTVMNGIPVEKIEITPTQAVGVASSMKTPKVVDIGGEACTYVIVKAGTQYGGLGAVIDAQVYPENASNKNLTWVVDNGEYNREITNETHRATVTQKMGHEQADTFNVYAVSADGTIKSNTVTVCVSKTAVKDNGNKIDQKPIEMTNKKTFDVSHSISFDGVLDGTYAACHKCNWYSSDESVFTVEPKNNANGDAKITAVDVGTATLYCVSAAGGYVDSCQVTVYPDKTYLKEIVSLCDKTVITRTKENRELYNKYMHRLDLAYYVLYDEPMSSQDTCDTYAEELLYAFYRLGGFVGIVGLNITEKNGNALPKEHITVNVGSVTSYEKYSYTFGYNILPKNSMYSDIKWTSSNASIKVENGKCYPADNDPCSAIITCTVKDYMGTEISDSVFLTFARKTVTGVSLNKTAIDGGKIGTTEQLTANVSPNSVGNRADCMNVYWSSSDESIATVDQNGLVQFNEGGNCVITCTTYDGGYTAQCDVNVVTNYTALELLVKQYNDLMLNPVNYYPDSWDAFTAEMEKAQQMLDYGKNSQKEVDEMYADLKNAYDSLQKYNYIQKVELYLDGEQTQEFYQYDLSLLSEGISYKNAVLDLNVRLYPNNASYRNVKWESSTTDISVSSDGKCSPTINSSCYGRITCTVYDHYGNVFTDSVWVSFSYYPVTSLGLSEQSIAGAIGTTHQLGCTVYPTGTSLVHLGAASIQDYYWESDNEEIATVDENGLVTFVSAGATVVRAVSYDGGISAECIVSTDGDRSAMLAAIEAYKDVDYQDYDYDYGMEFKAAYEKAVNSMNDRSMTQEQIDSVTLELNTAYNNLAGHEFVKIEDVNIGYTTYAKPLIGSASSVVSGTVGSNNSVSVNLSGSKYSNYNDYNYVTLNAAASPSNAMCQTVSWREDSSSSASVSINGNAVTVTPKEHSKGGAATLTCTLTDAYGRSVSKTVNVVLSDKVCTGLDITDTSRTVYATDKNVALNYTISGSPEYSAIKWTSSDESIVKVNENGVLTPVEKGTATITAVTLDGGFKDTVTVNVLTNFNDLASKQAEYGTLINDVKDSYTYTEESINVLAGYVADAQTMINEGRATQAQVNELIKNLDDAYNALEFYIAVTSLKLSAQEDASVSVVSDGYIRYTGSLLNGKQVSMTPVMNDEKAVYTDIKWESSNPNIIIDEYGVLTNKSVQAAVTKVTCTVTNVFGGKFTASAYVSFVKYGATGISFNEEMVFGGPQQTVTLNPVITNTGNSSLNSAVVKTCTYESSNPEIASVDENGVVTFNTQGQAVITVTTLDGGFTTTINVFTTWDTTALKAAIDEGDALTYTDYAYDYGMAFKSALDAAKAVYANIYASQQEIDNACLVLTQSMTDLEANPFVQPELTFVQGDTEVTDNTYVQVSADTQQATVSLSLNDGAMVKSSTISVADENGVTVAVDGTNALITKTAQTGSFTLSAVVIDDYDREYTSTITVNVIDVIIPVTDIVLTADGAEISGTVKKSCGGTYTKFSGLQVGYIAVPADANAITSVEYKSSASSYVEISNTGLITLTTAGKIRPSNTSTITCTVTSSDGTVVSKSFEFTITRA